MALSQFVDLRITRDQTNQVADILGFPMEHLHSIKISPSTYKNELAVEATYYHLNAEGHRYALADTDTIAKYTVYVPVEETD